MLIFKMPIISGYEQRVAFVEEAQEKLRRLHNAQAKILSKLEFNNWVKDYFKPRHHAVNNVLPRIRNEVKEVIRAKSDAQLTTVDLNTVFEEQ